MNRLDPFDGHDDEDDDKDVFIQSATQRQRSVSIEPQVSQSAINTDNSLILWYYYSSIDCHRTYSSSFNS